MIWFGYMFSIIEIMWHKYATNQRLYIDISLIHIYIFVSFSKRFQSGKYDIDQVAGKHKIYDSKHSRSFLLYTFRSDNQGAQRKTEGIWGEDGNQCSGKKIANVYIEYSTDEDWGEG